MDALAHHLARTAERATDMTRGYLVTAAWADGHTATTDTGDTVTVTADMFDAATVAAAYGTCTTFLAMHMAELETGHDDWGQHGHDLWLTRQGHGTGFWDRGYPADISRRITEAARELGEAAVDISDDGAAVIL